MVATNMIGVCEALLYGQKAGLDLSIMIDMLKKGSAGSHALTNAAPNMLKRNFEPGFYVEHFVKDLGICLSEAEKMNLNLPALTQATALYRELQFVNGEGRSSILALLKALEKINGQQVANYDI